MRARLRHRIQARVSILVAVGMLGPLVAIALLAEGGGRELERRVRAGRAQAAALVAERVQRQLSLELDALTGRPLPEAAVQGRLLAAVVRGYKPVAGETLDVLDGAYIVLASSDARRVGLHEPPRDDELLASAKVPITRWQVVVRQPLQEALGPFFDLSRKALLACAIALALALVFAWGAARSLTRPLSLLTDAAERISEGDLSQPIPRLDEDEVGVLGEALEHMRAELRDAVSLLESRVAERTAAVRKLLGQVIGAQEAERRRVARELHDETTQQLATLVMRLQSGDVKTASELAVQTLEGVHRLIVDLRPSVLDDLGLKSAILWYVEKHLKPLGINARCEFEGFDERLPPQLETVIFRVVQEALTNIARHAHASSVLVQCGVAGGRVDVEIEDDGQGFDLTQHNEANADGSGWGLLGMRERVEMLGGELHLDSAPGQGTHLWLSVPVPSSQEEALHAAG
ncbi:MAG TPA: ATP-binding protein [Myxococcales bacterium]|nr:ATP-binding protein [Myxococcales bacterium]